MWDVIAWFFRVAGEGVWPDTDYGGVPWPEDSMRARLAGEDMFSHEGRRCHAVLCEVAADLDEVAKTIGLADYRRVHGCLRCFKANANFDEFDVKSRKRKHDWFTTVASSCLSHHPVRDNDVDVLMANTKSKRTKAGLVVVKRMAAFPNLKIGDRIEPCVRGFPDVVHGQRPSDFPAVKRRILSYRRPKHSPLFVWRMLRLPGVQEGVYGLKAEHVLFDSMHVVELGCLLYWMAAVLINLLHLNYFGTYVASDDQDHLDGALTDSLKRFYDETSVGQNDRLSSLTVSMLGSLRSPYMKMKAGKAKVAYRWALDILENKGGAAILNDLELGHEGDAFLECGQGFRTYYSILAGQPRQMSDESLVQLELAIDQIVESWARSGQGVPMKWHVLGEHMVDQCKFSGNCTWTHNYADETENFGSRKRGSFLFRPTYTQNHLTKWYADWIGTETKRMLETLDGGRDPKRRRV